MRATLYVDMDGVLVDFVRGVKLLTGIDWNAPVSRQEKLARNHRVFECPNFWENLPPTRDFHTLWNYVVPYEPHILTAVPRGINGEPPSESSQRYAREGKWIWCEKYLGIPKDHFHAVFREHKQNYATKIENRNVISNILIDDTNQNIQEWMKNRGIGILHTSAADSISKLKLHGF